MAVPTAASAPPDINTGPDNTPSEICMVSSVFGPCHKNKNI
jgi:hypothetical protein